MGNYPDAVAMIVTDYLERVKRQLRLVPASEQDEFLRELESHVFEGYNEESGATDVERILAVLRKLGEPADVVSDRLPETMVRSGAKRTLLTHIVAGIVIALFGIPLGFGGAAIVMGVCVALAGLVVAFYALAGATILAGAVLTLAGLTRAYRPEVWDKMVALGFIQMDPQVAQVLEAVSPGTQGAVMVLLAALFLGVGVGMLWLGKYPLRGFRFLSGMVFEWIRNLAQRVGRRVRQEGITIFSKTTPVSAPKQQGVGS
jgi:uncharacterized membrane protein